MCQRLQAEDLLLGKQGTSCLLTLLRPTTLAAATNVPLLQYSILVYRATRKGGEGGGGDARRAIVSYEQVLEAKEAATLYPLSDGGGEEVGSGGQGDGVFSSGVAGWGNEVSDGERVGTHSAVVTEARVGEKEANYCESSDVLWMLEQVVDRLRAAAHGRGVENRLRSAEGNTRVASDKVKSRHVKGVAKGVAADLPGGSKRAGRASGGARHKSGVLVPSKKIGERRKVLGRGGVGDEGSKVAGEGKRGMAKPNKAPPPLQPRWR